jgi:hypothetical protein
MDDIPDFGDLAGLTRLYWRAVQYIRASDLQDGKALVLDEIDAQFGAARARFTESPRAD